MIATLTCKQTCYLENMEIWAGHMSHRAFVDLKQTKGLPACTCPHLLLYVFDTLSLLILNFSCVPD